MIVGRPPEIRLSAHATYQGRVCICAEDAVAEPYLGQLIGPWSLRHRLAHKPMRRRREVVRNLDREAPATAEQLGDQALMPGNQLERSVGDNQVDRRSWPPESGVGLHQLDIGIDGACALEHRG